MDMKIVLDIDGPLAIIEGIYKRYIDTSFETYRGSGMWRQGYRLPIVMVNDKKLKEKMSNTPISTFNPNLPYLCLPTILEYCLGRAYANFPSNITLHLNNNISIKGISKCLYDYNGFMERDSELINYLPVSIMDNMSTVEYKLMAVAVENIVKQIMHWTDMYPERVYNIDYSTIYIVLEIGEDILSYRYKEYLKWDGYTD